VNIVNRVVEYKTVRVRVKAEAYSQDWLSQIYTCSHSLNIFTSLQSSAFVREVDVEGELSNEDVMDY
jgi:hypothetical protein